MAKGSKGRGTPPKDPPKDLKPGDPGTVTVKGRHSKRKIFFERHTGAGAQILAAAVVLFALVSILLSRCEGKEEAPDSSAASTPNPNAAVIIDSIPIAPPVTPEPEPEPEPPAEPVNLAFTEDQVAQYNALLDAWAEEETLVKKPDAEGNVPEDAPLEPDGGHSVAVWFYDIDSGATYAYREQERFSYASLMKAPYALYLYQKAEAGELDLEEKLTVSAGHVEEYKDNTGVLKEMDLPQDFTVEQLIGMAIRHSDTIALKTLLGRWPADGFRAWAGEQGIENPDELRGVTSGQICAADAGLLMVAIYRYIHTGQYGATLHEHMLNTGNIMIKSQYPVARKYGWDEKAYHDMAIIEAPHPALLVIMTDKWGGSWAEREMFGTVAAALEAGAAELWAAAG